MPIEVIDKIKQKNGGTFKLMDAKDIAIDDNNVEDYIKKIKEEVEKNNEELIKKVNLDNVYDKQEVDKKIFHMPNMGQDVKEAMTGGSVAVVGEDAVDTINIKKGAVDEEKLSIKLKNKLNDFTNSLNNKADKIDVIKKTSSDSLLKIIDEKKLKTFVGYNFNKNGVETKLSDQDWWCISDFIKIPENGYIDVTAYAPNQNLPCVVLYNKDKEILDTLFGEKEHDSDFAKFNGKFNTLLNNKAIYIRILGNFHNSEKFKRESKIYKHLGINDILENMLAPEILTEDLFYNREILDFNLNKRLNNDGTLWSDDGWSCSDFIKVKDKMLVRGYGFTQDRVVIAMYDSEKRFLQAIKGEVNIGENFYYTEKILTENECAYIRIVSYLKKQLLSSCKKFLNLEETLTHLNNSLSKEAYKDTIFFTVSVNQNFDNNKDIANSIQDTESFKPVYCALRLPKNYKETGKPTKIAVVMHGAGGKVTENNAGELNMFTDLLLNGYAIFDVNGSNNDYIEHSDHMGSSRVISAYLKAFEWIKEKYNVEDRLYVHGHSMGGLTALNFAIQNPSICKVLGLYHPVVDLYNQAWLHPWFNTTKQQIAIEYNFDDKTGATFEKDKIIGFNPIENKSVIINQVRYNALPCPLKIWHGNADTTVSLQGSKDYIKAVKNCGCRGELRELEGVRHEHTDAMYKELTIWFNRF